MSHASTPRESDACDGGRLCRWRVSQSVDVGEIEAPLGHASSSSRITEERRRAVSAEHGPVELMPFVLSKAPAR